MKEESEVQNIFKAFRPLQSLVAVSLPGIMENQSLGFRLHHAIYNYN
jgi:hypothetical protein